MKHFLCKFHLLLLLFTGVLTTGRLHAQTPDDFNPGANSNIYPLAVQADGRILVGGYFTTLGGQPRSRIARLNADGSLDPGFNPGADDGVYCLAAQEDGKTLVGGRFTKVGGQPRNYIARLNADGSLDPGFNPGADNSIFPLAVQADGKILVGGLFTRLGGQPRSYIARLNADGSLDTSFNPGANSPVYSLAVQEDGKILMGGYFTTLGGQPRNRIARLNTDGSLDPGFNPGTDGLVRSLVVQADGKILFGGDFTMLGGQPRKGIARVNADGSLDPGFNPGMDGNLHSLALQADGKILVGRYFSTPVGQTINPIVRLNADGSLDPGFNPEANGYANSLAVQADGKILLGGDFTTLEGQPRNRIARLSNDPATSNLVVSGSSRIDWLRGGSAPEVAQVTFWNWNGSAWVNLGNAARVSGGWRMTDLSLPAGGWIQASGRTSGGVFNGGSGIVAQVASHGDGPFPDIAVTAGDGAPLASGTGTLDFGSVIWPEVSVARSITLTNAGDGPLSGLAVSITGEHAADFISGSLAKTSLAPGESTTLQVGFASPRGAGLRGAELSITSNDADESPYRINLQGNLAHADPGFNPGANSYVVSLTVQPDGKILVGGDFTTLGGQPRSGIARLNADGSLDPGFNPGAAGTVNSLAVQADGRILVGGYFAGLGGQPRKSIARLTADGSLDPGFNPGADSSVFSLALQADGKILVGGRFTTLGGQPRNYLARLNADGNLDPSFNPGTNGDVYSLAVQADGKILVGGLFTTLGGQSRHYIARLNADGSLDSGFNPGADSYVVSLTVQADGRILLGGFFTTLGGERRNRIARLNADGSLDPGFNPGADGYVLSLALQADGKILVGGGFTTLGGQPRNYMARLNADGSLDSSYPPEANGSVHSLALQADGKILVGGGFSMLGGQARNYLARLNNDPATSNLVVSGSDRIDWVRGGSAPEVEQVIFENWNGSAWMNLGNATRVSGGWRMTGLSLPAGGWIRASGRTSGGTYNGSSGVVTQTTFPLVPFAGYTVGTPYQAPAVISFRKLLTKTSASDGGPITVTAAGPASANGGTVLLLTDSIRYTPPNGFSGADTFAITLSEASGTSVTGTVTVNVGPAPNAGGIGRNPPVITTLPDGKVGISFQGIPGRSYLVQRSLNDLEHWETIATLTADHAGKVTFTDDNPPPDNAFYRLGLP